MDIEKIVDRFLGWKLPEDFSPDAGISFKRPEELYPQMEHPENEWPVGTNLLTADQASEMVKHILKGEEDRVDIFIKKIERVLESESDRGLTCSEAIGVFELFKKRILDEWDREECNE
jgi:hypothetical protein